MNSWIHVLARFTPEAILIEGLILCLLVATYLGFWILKKRRFGASQEVVPAAVLKTYLNEVIYDAESLRAQLFGLLRQAGVDAGSVSAAMTAPAPTSASVAPGTVPADLAVVIASLTSDKQRLEKELADLRALQAGASAAAPSQPASGASGAQVAALKEQVASLEARLAEYSVIEDDLANLKRLQQENAKLKAALQSGGGALVSEPLPASEPATPAPEPLAEPTPEPLAEPVAEPMPEPVAEPSAEAAQEPLGEITAGLDALAEADASATDASLATDTNADPLGALTGATAAGEPQPVEAEPAGPGPSAPKPDKSDADLVAEFEKMLNG